MARSVKIQWWKIEAIMAECVRGRVPTLEESNLLGAAYHQAPVEYARRHKRIKQEAIREISMMWCRKE